MSLLIIIILLSSSESMFAWNVQKASQRKYIVHYVYMAYQRNTKKKNLTQYVDSLNCIINLLWLAKLAMTMGSILPKDEEGIEFSRLLLGLCPAHFFFTDTRSSFTHQPTTL